MRTRSTRRALAKLLAVLMAMSLIAAACGGGDDDDGDLADVIDEEGTDAPEEEDVDDPEPVEPAQGAEGGNVIDEDDGADPTVFQSSEAPVYGGTLRVGVEAETDGLNPTSNNFAVSAYIMGRPVFDPVAYVDNNGDWFPWLAESFAPVEGSNSWQMKLREGILFHDGTPLNADAIVANFNAVLLDPLISIAVRPNFPPDNRIEVIDDLTVQFNLIREYANFPFLVSNQLGMIASPAWLAAAAEDEALDQRPVGTGPFVFESRTADASTKLVKNQDYWAGAENIYLDAIEIFPITDAAVSASRLAAGDLDIVVTSNADATLTLRESSGVTAIENVLSEESDIMMNTGVPPFDDIRVRQALTFSADREGYRSLIKQDTAPLADSIFHPDLIWNNPDVVQEGNMPELAGPLIEAYCGDFPENCSDGRVNMELQSSGPSVENTRTADLFSQGWEPFFNITREELLQDEHIVDVAVGRWNVVTWRQFGSPDPDGEVIWLECATVGPISLNWVRNCVPERDELLFRQRASTDLDERVAIWKEIQQEMHDAYTYIFTVHTNWTVGARNAVKNICGQTAPGGETLLCNNAGTIFMHNIWIDE